MLTGRCFTSEWIDLQQQATGCRNPIMLEKAIIALQLVGHLAEAGLDFHFKGGTSLLLRVAPIRRLSIDVDIVTPVADSDFLAIIRSVSRLAPFAGFEHDADRDAQLPPKKHFKLFYRSVVQPRQDHVLLDVLFESVQDTHVAPVIIRTDFIELARNVNVRVPLVDSLLGDKLTAFARTTIGILYDERRKLDIVKQLFDVGALFDAATDLEVVADVYTRLHERHCFYRKATYSIQRTADDTIEACFQLTAHGLRGVKQSEYGRLLNEGVSALANHLVNSPFQRDHARVAAGKAACVAAWIKSRPQSISIQSLQYDVNRSSELGMQTIGSRWTPLQKLRGANPEAFYYWWQAQHLSRNVE